MLAVLHPLVNNAAVNNSASHPLVAVTGAGGFIGSHLVELLLGSGYRVRALVHYNGLGRIGHLDPWAGDPNLEIIAGDVQDPRCLRALLEGCAAVFHLAALIGIPYSYLAPQSYLQVNAAGTLNLLEACRDAGAIRLIHTSTSEVYGSAQRTPMDESHPLRPQSPYAASKAAADHLADAYARSFGLEVVMLRPFNAFGPRQSARAVIPTVLAQLLAPASPRVSLGSLESIRDWTYVEDTARAFVAAAEAPAFEVGGRLFNVATGNGQSVEAMARLAMEVTGIEKPIVSTCDRVRPPASEVDRLIGSAAAFTAATGWQPQVSFRDGLARTAEAIRAHPEFYRPAEYSV